MSSKATPVEASGIWWHGSGDRVDSFDPACTRDGGLHFGSRDQASMRNPRWLHKVAIEASRPVRMRDEGDGWKEKVRKARRAGKDAILYLNRYEGMTSEIIERLDAAGKLRDLDRVSDAAFRKLVPEAKDSIIVFDAEQVKLLDVEPGKREEVLLQQRDLSLAVVDEPVRQLVEARLAEVRGNGFDQCRRTSHALADDLVEAGVEARVLRCAGLRVDVPDVDPRWLELGSRSWFIHYVVAVDEQVFDLTARQFHPAAPAVRVQALEDFRQEWNDVEDDISWRSPRASEPEVAP